MYRITYEHIDEKGSVTDKQVWDVPAEGSVLLEESCQIRYTYPIGSDTPDGTERGPTTLQINAVLDPHKHWAPYHKELARKEIHLDSRTHARGPVGYAVAKENPLIPLSNKRKT